MAACKAPSDRGLVRVGVYDRTIAASRERVWENVRDWEHLPWLHAASFASIECLEAGDRGWRARIGVRRASGQGTGRDILLELVIDQDEPRYVSRTLEGGGAGSEIWTRVDARARDETLVHVEFWVPEVGRAQAEALGLAYRTLYTRLWDEDEAMMIRRERELRLRERPRPGRAEPVSLGHVDELRAELPRVVRFGGRSFRIVLHEGVLVAHATVCPHMLGPLDRTPVREGRVVCPWHGYAFDLATGRECGGRRLKLAPPPRVELDPENGEVWLAPAR